MIPDFLLAEAVRATERVSHLLDIGPDELEMVKDLMESAESDAEREYWAEIRRRYE